MSEMPDEYIGGAHVMLTFTRGERRMVRGQTLTAEEVLSMPIANRRALADSHYIKIFPKGVAALATEPPERFMITTSKGEYSVIEGRKINSKPLSREAAEKLIARE